MYFSRKRLLMPSASTTRSASEKRASSSKSVFEQQDDAEFARPLLKDQSSVRREQPQNPLPPDPVHRAAKMHGDIVPIGEFFGDAAIARGIVFFEIVQRGVGEHHAEPEGVVGAVALVDRDLGLRPLLLKQDRGIEAGGSATDDRDFHQSLRRRGLLRLF
jgi:hypothetical protein